MASALIIVDLQNDFAQPDGALAAPGGDLIVPAVNDLVSTHDWKLVVATRDWHPEDHSSFVAQGGPWPMHCVRDTPGAQFHPALNDKQIDLVINKGEQRELEEYSGFRRPELIEALKRSHIDALTVVGLATEYCVKSTAEDALSLGFPVEIICDAIRSVDVDAGDGERALVELAEKGARIARSKQAVNVG